MADQAPGRMPAAFPTPPPYYKHFTKQNVTKMRQVRKEATSNKDKIDVSSLPPELGYLVPPEPPADGRYKSFGTNHDLAQPATTLSEAGIPELYPAQASHLDPTPHLLTLIRSVLLNFLELVGTLSVNPTQGPEKIEHLQNLFYNLHDLINRYRPHQARESLILTMEDQLDKIKAHVKSVGEAQDNMQKLLNDIHAQGDQKVDTHQQTPTSTQASQKPENLHKAMWHALDHELID